MESKFSFGLIADCQYADADDKTFDLPEFDFHTLSHFRESANRLRDAIAELNKHNLAFTVHLGDLVDHSLDDAKVPLGAFCKSHAPVKQVMGNHDYSHRPGESELINKTYGLQNPYYDFAIENWRFVVLDSNEMGIIKPAKDSDEYRRGEALLAKLKSEGNITAHHFNGGIDAEQMNWLDDVLQKAQNNDEKVILFAHHPIFPPNFNNMLNYENVLAKIDQFSCVKAFINGHNHLGNFGEREGVSYLTVQGMINAEGNAFAIAHVYDDRIEIEGFGREPSRTLSLN